MSAARLADVLAGGDFIPFTADEIDDGRDRALANKLVTTALRRHGHIDLVMKDLLERGLPKGVGSFEATLRLGIAQLLYLPEVGDHSAVHLAVEAIKPDPKARRYAALMNAALRKTQAEAERFRALPVEQALPAPVRQAWARSYGPAAVSAAAENLIAGAALDLTLRDDDPALVAALGAKRVMADTVRVDSRDAPVTGLPGYGDGRWWVQDVAAAIPARLLNVPAGSRVLDMCAAPGGKTAQLVKAGYRVTAIDSSAARLVRLKQNLDRLGYAAEIVEADATTYASATMFDAVLLDAPCSATGTFRRHPEVVWHCGTARIENRIGLQRSLLKAATNCLNPGGVLVYCVCSLEAGEGEGQLDWIRDNLPALLHDPIDRAEMNGLPQAVTAGGHVRTHPGLEVPGHMRGTLDGFFVTRFRRR